MTREKLIEEIMRECKKDGEPVTKKEAAEMADMELKAKKDCKRYESDITARKKPQREKKIDSEKITIINFIVHTIQNLKGISNILIVNNQKEISFSVGENSYSLTLTKHRKKRD